MARKRQDKAWKVSRSRCQTVPLYPGQVDEGREGYVATPHGLVVVYTDGEPGRERSTMLTAVVAGVEHRRFVTPGLSDRATATEASRWLRSLPTP